MKVTSLLFAAMMATVHADSSPQQRGLATLAQKWNISEPTFSYGDLTFALDFGVSSFVEGAMVGYTLWDENCQEGAQPLTIGAEMAVTDDKSKYTTQETTNVAMDRDIMVNVTVNPEAITANSFIYSEDTTIGQVTAEIRFCIRFGLFTPSSTRVEVNFLETIVTLTVDLSDGFAIGSIAVEPKDKLVRTANQVYEVEGWQCKGATNAVSVQLTDTEKAERRNQGSVIKVCVTPKLDARNDGIFMRSIDSFTFSRGGTITQEAVLDRLPAANQLTSLDCTRGDLICSFETILFAAFYTSLGSVDGSGIASMQFGSATGRRLRSGGRNTQQAGEDVAGAAEFELTFDVLPTADDGTSGAANAGVMAMAVLAISGAVALL